MRHTLMTISLLCSLLLLLTPLVAAGCNCRCSGCPTPPGPPIAPPVEPPVTPPVEPPVTPPITPPVAPPGPPITCNAGAACTVTEECAVECSVGSVAYCLECVDSVCQTTSLCTIGGCSAENRTCLDPPTPVAPPVTPPVEPPVTPPPVYDCTNEGQIAGLLLQCQTECGSGCAQCSDVYTFCEEAGSFTANATLDACTLNAVAGLPTSLGPCPFLTAVQFCCSGTTPVAPIAPPVTPPVAPPVAPAPTAICTVATFDAGYTCISNPASGLVCSQRAVTCAASIAGNANSTEAGECLLNSISASGNTVDCDYEANVQTCCGVNVIGLACTNQNECPENYVCTGDPGTCSGIEGASCNATQQCSYAYNCVAGTCTNAASDAFQAPATVNNCTYAPSVPCNSTFSIALREDNELTSTLVCDDPLTPYAPGNSVAFFYLPTSTLAVNTYNVSFSVYAPNDVNFAVRQLLPCTAGTVCGTALVPQQPALNLFQYNEIVTLSTPGEQRGYILFGGSSFAPLNGYIVNVSVQCGYVVPENCQQVVRQSCVASRDCPLSAPYCNTTLGSCQTLIGGACNATTDCAEAYGITCEVNSCTCVGTAEDVCSAPTYLTALENCLFAAGTPTNCTQVVANCYDQYLGTNTTNGALVLAQFQQLATCSLGSFNPSIGCGISGCLDSFCNAASCPAIVPRSCTSDADCTNAYPFCDTYNGVCTGAGGSPCKSGSDCGTRLCLGDSCTCLTLTSTRCTTPQGREQIEVAIENCISTKNGTCAERMAVCQTASYTPNGINDVTLISNINTCVAASSPPLCNAENCVINECASPNNCLIDEQCTCGQCCQGFTCSICPDTCSTSADCPGSRPICASNGRCTSNTDCGSPEPPVQPPKQITPLPNLLSRPLARETPTAVYAPETEPGWLDWFWTLLEQQD